MLEAPELVILLDKEEEEQPEPMIESSQVKKIAINAAMFVVFRVASVIALRRLAKSINRIGSVK